MQRLAPIRLRPTAAILLAVIAQFWFLTSAGAFTLSPNTRWISTASNTSTGTYGDPITLTWSLVPDGTAISGGYAPTNGTSSNLISTFDAAFGAGLGGSDLTQRPWFALFSDCFNRWNQLGGINFVYEPHDTTLTLGNWAGGTLGTRGDIRIGGTNMDNSNGTFAQTIIPQTGDILFDTADISVFANSVSSHVIFRNTLMHETGHAFGLQHLISDTNDFLMEPIVNWKFDGPQLDDVCAIQYFYGDPNEKSHNMQGNNTAALATALGSIAMGSSIDVGSSAVGKDTGANMVVSPTESDFVSVFGTRDADYYSFNVSSAAKLTAVLTPRGGAFSQGLPGGPAATYNANNKNDLSFALFGSDGTTQLALVNASGAGSAETLSSFALPGAGQYCVRVSGATADTVQLYDLHLSLAAIPITGDYNHNGVVDAADYALWRLTFGQTGTGLAADGNDSHQIDAGDYDIWRAHFGSASPIAIPGDYNHNGVVDAADYSLWRLTFGQTGTGLAADGNNNNRIDAGDYELWRAHFGQTANGGTSMSSSEFLSAVPEPKTSLLALAAVIGVAFQKRKIYSRQKCRFAIRDLVCFPKPQLSGGQPVRLLHNYPLLHS